MLSASARCPLGVVGERSFTTLSLLLALGNVSDVPFAIFDEIDVFMDEVNRKVTLKALVEVAKQKRDTRQYVILTPHNLSTIKKDETTQVTPPPTNTFAGRRKLGMRSRVGVVEFRDCGACDGTRLDPDELEKLIAVIATQPLLSYWICGSVWVQILKMPEPERIVAGGR